MSCEKAVNVQEEVGHKDLPQQGHRMTWLSLMNKYISRRQIFAEVPWNTVRTSPTCWECWDSHVKKRDKRWQYKCRWYQTWQLSTTYNINNARETNKLLFHEILIDCGFLYGILPFWPHFVVFQSGWMHPVASYGIQEPKQKNEETGQIELLAEEGTSCSSCSDFWLPSNTIDRLPIQLTNSGP